MSRRSLSARSLNAPPINQPWAWFTLEMMESGAMRSLSVNALRVLYRIQIEHMAHAGLENGCLKVTWLDFVNYGINRKFLNKAITDVTAVGLVAITFPGRKAHGQDHGDPTQYRLTFLPVGAKPPTNEWKRFGTSIKAAKDAVNTCRRKSANGEDRGASKAWPMPP